MPRKSDIRLGQLLIQKQWCSLRQVNTGLQYQKEQKGALHQALGRILVGQGVLDEALLMEALAELGALVMSCKNCVQHYSVSEFTPGEEYACHDCRHPLVLGEPSNNTSSMIPYHSSTAVHPTTLDPAVVGNEEAKADVSEEEEANSGSGPPDSYIGKVFGGCKIFEKIAAGGMGVVYKAQQLNLNRIVAVKVLSKALSNDESFVRRFIEEARSAAQLNHGNIVHINDVGDYHGIFYFTMEFVDGVNLKDILQTETHLPIDRSLKIILQVCTALRHAHNRGIIHRDIKPENIMITRDGVVKLADLGLAKKMTPSGTENLTQAGSILGTPFYMPPEQAKDFSRVDARSDIYSLGVTLFRMITGGVPFTGRTPIEVMIKVIDGSRSRLRELREDASEEVERVVDRMMQRDPDDRYQTVDELMADLKELSIASKEDNELGELSEVRT